MRPSLVSRQLLRDPWAKREAWRKNPIFSNRQMFGSMFPGLGIAVVAFTGYVIYDNIQMSKEAKVEHHADH